MRTFGRHVLSRPGTLAAYVFAAVLLLLAVVGPAVAPYDPTQADIGNRLAAPSAEHWFGTDSTGLDVFSRVICAPRTDLAIAVIGVLVSMGLGVALGLVSGYAETGLGGVVSAVILRVTEMIQSFPVFVLAMALVASSGQKMTNVIYAVAFVNVPFYLRMVHTESRVLRRRAFVESARVSGVRPPRIVARHILPNALTPALAQMSVNFGWAILLTAGLSFAGAGVRMPTPEWGLMIAQGVQDTNSGAWWTAVFPGVALTATVACFALVGRSLEEALGTGGSGAADSSPRAGAAGRRSIRARAGWGARL
ncbi:MAG: peptide/nickel transport system permease protein [Solirubrobacteraceae bacterium]|nr:peptide/nickel transport system permease protein [Solirubrobacteraceae bacterium]